MGHLRRLVPDKAGQVANRSILPFQSLAYDYPKVVPMGFPPQRGSDALGCCDERGEIASPAARKMHVEADA